MTVLDRNSRIVARSARDPRPPLPITADQSRGASNLATVPFAGNISTDTRAGRAG